MNIDIDREYGIAYFKEERVALVIADLAHKAFDLNFATDEQFYDIASNQGTVFSLQGFTKFVESGEFNKLSDTLKSTEYLFLRFISFYENEGEVYCNNERNISIDDKEEEGD